MCLFVGDDALDLHRKRAGQFKKRGLVQDVMPPESRGPGRRQSIRLGSLLVSPKVIERNSITAGSAYPGGHSFF
jgi:hypothetical protein